MLVSLETLLVVVRTHTLNLSLSLSLVVVVLIEISPTDFSSLNIWAASYYLFERYEGRFWLVHGRTHL